MKPPALLNADIAGFYANDLFGLSGAGLRMSCCINRSRLGILFCLTQWPRCGPGVEIASVWLCRC
jgi:hypothetical protein